MSFPSGDVVVTPFVGADNKSDGTVAPPQCSDFFEDVYVGDYYDGLVEFHLFGLVLASH